MDWFQNNWLSCIIILLVIIIFIGFIFYLCKKNGIKKVALDAILEAEKYYNTKTGQERFEYAVSFVYTNLPNIIQSIIPEKLALSFCKSLVQKTFDDVKSILDYQKPKGVDDYDNEN